MIQHFNHPDIDTLFSERSIIRKYIEVEKALALVQGRLGVIPEKAAKAIVHSLDADKINLEEFNEDFKKIGFPIVGLIKQLNQQVDNGFGEYLHWGATTQDIMDTGLVLLLRDFVELLQKQITQISEQLILITETHLKTRMVGRSQLQHAIPITFGYKAATWLAPILRFQKKLKALLPDLYKVQFGGAVGTLASLGEIGFDVKRELAIELDLSEAEISWHTQRDQLAGFVTSLGVFSTSISKIGKDILYMTQTEVGEIVERGEGKSSTMPNKRNPINTQNILLAGQTLRSQINILLESAVQDHERGSATWQLEWVLIPNICSQMYFSVSTLNKLLSNIDIKADRMLENMNLSGSVIYAEAIMMILAKKVGRQIAHDLVDEAVSESLLKEEISFEQALFESKKISEILSKKEIEKVLLGKEHVKMAALSAKKMLELVR